MLLLSHQTIDVVFIENQRFFSQSQEEFFTRREGMIFLEFFEDGRSRFDVILLKECGQDLLSLLLFFAIAPPQQSLNLSLSLGCMCIINPITLHVHFVRTKHFDLVAALEMIADGYELVIYLCPKEVASQKV